MATTKRTPARGRLVLAVGGADWLVGFVASACAEVTVDITQVRSVAALGNAVKQLDPDGILVLGSSASAVAFAEDVRTRYRRLPVGLLDMTGTLDEPGVICPVSATGLAEAVDVLLRTHVPRMPESRPPISLTPSLLTPAQSEVLSLISEGYSNAQIARIRGTNVRAVEALVTRVFDRLDPAVRRYGNARVAAARAYLGAQVGHVTASTHVRTAQPAMAG